MYYRSDKVEEAYRIHRIDPEWNKECPLCHESIVIEFEHWRVIENRFPYDLIAKVHHLLVPKRHITEPEFTDEEYAELFEIKSTYFNDKYQYIFEAVPNRKSIPEHFHLHLIDARTDLDQD